MYEDFLVMAIRVLVGIVGFFVVYWIKEIRDNIKTIVKRMDTHDKRLDSLEAFRRELTTVHNSLHNEAPLLPPNGK